MNVPKTNAIIEAEMKIRDYRDNPIDIVYYMSLGSIDTLKNVGVISDSEHSAYTERMGIIRKANTMDTPATGDN